MTIRLYNSLTRTKEEFVPLQPGQLGIYVCGPTVYGHSHIGHAKSYIAFDVIVKWFRHEGYQVRYVQNITDVGHLTDNADDGEDKIERQARLDQVHPLEVVDNYMRSYFEDMESLLIAHPNMYVRATQHVGEQIELTEKLIEKGHAYVVEGNVYFDVSSWKDYGVLSGRKSADQEESGRIQSRSDKRDPRDFALWKSTEGTGHILRWNSPWGEGYPGWHLECSAMAMKYLGDTFDIHGGGMENKFPHHECEIAQSRSATDGQFARYWVHNNMINVDGQKMGKSLGNSVYVKDALKEFKAEAMRLFLLSTHYGRPSNYTEEGMHSATRGTQRLQDAHARLSEAASSDTTSASGDAELLEATESCKSAFGAAMDDNFNTPIAISVLFDWVKAINTSMKTGVSAAAAAPAQAVMEDLAGTVLGILVGESDAASKDGDLADPLMQILIELRKSLRANQQFELADGIRDSLEGLNVELKDSPDGTTWSQG